MKGICEDLKTKTKQIRFMKMFSLFSSKASLKAFKVSLNSDRNKKHGIAADSLLRLKEKCREKFKIEVFSFYLAKDATLIDEEEFFTSLEPQTHLIVAEKDEEVKTGEKS